MEAQPERGSKLWMVAVYLSACLLFVAGPAIANAAPTLTSISPTAVKPGMTMTLTGSGFGATQSSVTFSATGDTQGVTSFMSWSDTQIVLTVPNAIVPGSVIVTVGGVQSNGVAYTTIAPTLTSISPGAVKPGMTMTLTGSGFGLTRGVGGATFSAPGDTQNTLSFISWSDTQVVLTVPNSIVPGTITLSQNGMASNGIAYGTIPAILTGISPAVVKPGMQMTLTGSGFGASQGVASVGFSAPGDTQGVHSFLSWSDTQIVLTVPNSIVPGTITVTQNGLASNGVSYATIAPTLTSISPASVKPGMTMTLTGSGFGATQGVASATFSAPGDTQGVHTFTSWTDTQIVLTAPNSIVPGTITVSQNGVSSNGLTYTTIAPTLTSISPTALKPGMTMTLTGSGFGTTRGVGGATFSAPGDTQGVTTFASWSDTQIVLTVPNSIVPGTITVSQNGVSSNGITYATIAPTLTSISPTAIKPGMTMTLTGSGFGTTRGVGGATLSAPGDTQNVITFSSWSDTQIVATVPNSIVPGTITVSQNGVASNGVAYTTVAPTLTSISPTAIKPGMAMTLTGSGFGTTQGVGSVTFAAPGDTVGVHSFTSWSDTQIVLTVPSQIAPGTLTVSQNGVPSNGKTYTTIAPTLTSISPTAIKPGISMTLTGSGFATTQGIGSVTFSAPGDTVGASSFTSWSDTQIVLTVPNNIAAGNVWVDQNGTQSNSLAYTVNGPSITSLSPTSGPTGTPVTINGANFGSTQSGSTVTFNGTPASPTTWGATSIVVPVPSGATTGPVVVTVGGVSSNGVTFTDTSAPTITSISPTSGKAGTVVTINGSLFGSTQGSSKVTFNGVTATVTSWIATKIVVTAPTGVTTGNVIVTVGGVASNAVLFVVAPTITSLSPTSGAITAPVTITGTNFGNARGTSTITFNGVAAISTTWSATSIVVPVPTGATTGPVIVTVQGAASNAVTFTITGAPSITSLSPTSGGVGQVVTITGTNFGATKGTSTVTFNGTAATPNTWSATSIKVPVPSGATSGNVVVTVNGVASNGIAFTVFPTPNISTLSPTSGPVGTTVTITGTNFGPTQGASTLTFNAKPATASSWSPTQIIATVPTGATTGPVVVMVNGVPSNGVTFTVNTAPLITGIAPLQGPVGAAVTITGANFGATKGTSTVKFNGTTATPTTWSATSIVVPVPTGATTGPLVVTVGGLSSNGITFTVLPTPTITSLSPTSGAVGTSVTITGTNFGSSQGTSTVTFNGVGAAPTSWTATRIIVLVPTGATTGPVVVTVNGVPSNGVTFTVLPTPTITQVVPGAGAVGQSITITGTNFGATKGTSTVTFNGTGGTPTTWSATSIVVPVPTGAISGNLVVTVGGVPSNGIPFTVLTTPSITSISPTSGSAGTSVTINGTNFGGSQNTSSVTFNGLLTVPTSWSATQIVAPAPTSVTTGPVVVTVNGAPSNGVTFTVLAPTITSLSPTSGGAGTLVTITGTNFGSTQGTGTVKFNAASAIPQSWSGTSIVVPVPSGATTGNVVATVGGVASNGVSFTVNSAPGITALSPASGNVGTVVTITGNGFGATKGLSTVTFNGKTATPQTWGATQIVAPVPTGGSPGSVVVTVNGLASNSLQFGSGLNSSITGLEINPTAPDYGQLVSYTATVSGFGGGPIPTGTVAFSYKDTQNNGGPLCLFPIALDANGMAVCQTIGGILGIFPGIYTVSAVYSGDSYYATSTGTGSLNVQPGPTTTTVTPVPPNNVTNGTQLTFTVTVTVNSPFTGSLPPTGLGSVTDTGAQNALELEPLGMNAATASPIEDLVIGAGVHTLVGEYIPDDTSPYAYSNCCNYQVTVNQAPPASVTATYIPTYVYFNYENPTTVTMNATVLPPAGGDPVPTGEVSLSDEDGGFGSCALDGTGSCALSFSSNDFLVPLTVTTDTVFPFTMVAAYGGDSNYTGASSTPFVEEVECDNYEFIDDYFEYADVYDPYGYAYYTDWVENEETITYNCQAIQLSDDIQTIDSGTDACEWVDYQTYCDGLYLWESDEYWCDDFGQNAYYWTDWYQIDYCGASRYPEGGK
jgi:hypothetical protein